MVLHYEFKLGTDGYRSALRCLGKVIESDFLIAPRARTVPARQVTFLLAVPHLEMSPFLSPAPQQPLRL